MNISVSKQQIQQAFFYLCWCVLIVSAIFIGLLVGSIEDEQAEKQTIEQGEP